MQYKNISLLQYLGMIAEPKPTPGGGSVSAYAGALGAALARMVLSLAVRKRPLPSLSDAQKQLKENYDLLALLSELDSRAYDDVCTVYRLRGRTKNQKKKKSQRIQHAMKQAMDIPYRAFKICANNLFLMSKLAEISPRNALPDLMVGVRLTESALAGCKMNVETNLRYLNDQRSSTRIKKELASIEKKSATMVKNIFQKISQKMK